MKEQEIKQFLGMRVESIVLDSRMVVKGTLRQVENEHVRFSSIEDVFVLVHGKRLSTKLMLAGSFSDLEALLKNLFFPCSIFDECKALKKES